MALHDFWQNVRAGFRNQPQRGVADSPRLTAAEIEQILRREPFWLKPRTVAGYQPDDFDFLPKAERAKLTRLVGEFLKVAAKVPFATAATANQIALALLPFQGIVALLEFDRYEDAEAYRIGKQIERTIDSHRPRALAELRFYTRADWTGDPGVWIWAYLSEKNDDEFLRAADEIHPILSEASRDVAPERFPYILFCTLADQAELLAELLETQTP